jgi:NitT/TauT family transport system ATP-binding protein
MQLEIDGISKSFGPQSVFSNFSARFGENAITVLLGPSGCGKTSLLRMIAGLLPPDSGSISGAESDDLSFVFQEPRLIPWLSVEDNVALAARDRLAKAQARERALGFLSIVGLDSFAQRKPRALSGGMRQRASLARAFCRPAGLLLMDEPFQSLDLRLRLSLMDEFVKLWEREPKTVVFVTHDIQEALYLGDEVLSLGGSPAEIIDRFSIRVRRGERDLGDPAMSELERRLYFSLVKGRGRPLSTPVSG